MPLGLFILKNLINDSLPIFPVALKAPSATLACAINCHPMGLRIVGSVDREHFIKARRYPGLSEVQLGGTEDPDDVLRKLIDELPNQGNPLTKEPERQLRVMLSDVNEVDKVSLVNELSIAVEPAVLKLVCERGELVWCKYSPRKEFRVMLKTGDAILSSGLQVEDGIAVLAGSLVTLVHHLTELISKRVGIDTEQPFELSAHLREPYLVRILLSH